MTGPEPSLDFSEAELTRYARHILLPEIGAIGQARLRAASVLVIGAGGLGSPLILYLAAAGVGRIGIIDDDVVELSNLQRQIAHGTPDLGRPKALSAAEAARRLNPEVRVEPHSFRLDPSNAQALIAAYDLVCDGSDNFATRYLVADAAHLAGRPLVSAAVLRFEGQLALFPPEGPCYRCLYPEPPPPGEVPSCSEAGVFGAVTGVMGALQAVEALKYLAGAGETLSRRLLMWDALSQRFDTITLMRDPHCALCGEAPRICDLSHHAPSPPLACDLA